MFLPLFRVNVSHCNYQKNIYIYILTENTTVLEQQNNKQNLQILEVIHNRMKQPKLNRINFWIQYECT